MSTLPGPVQRQEEHVRIIHTESSVVMGGQERRVLAESAGMRERGHEVWIVTPGEGDLAERAEAAGVRVIPFAYPRLALPINALRLASIVRRLRPDILNSHSSADSWTAALAWRLGPRPGALVRSRHISTPVVPGPLHRFLYGQADFVITTGESVRGGLADSRLVPPDRSMSIPTGVDPDRFRPRPERRAEARSTLDLPAEAPVVGVVAYLRPDKGHAVLMRAMPSILETHPDCVLCVVGEGPERDRLTTLADTLNLRSAVRFAGHREDIPEVLAAFDAFCLPSVRNEGVPQSLLQASACGLPVASTAVGGIPEAVVHEETGFVVPPADETALAHAVRRLLGDPQLRRLFGAAGRRHVEDAFSTRRMLDRTERAYAAALEARRGGRAASTDATGR
jgi:glycosyltransferase involved in cell wall biosynthesis